MDNHQHTETVHYVISFIAFILLASCFATTLFTGNPALVQFDSLAGSLVLGIIFLMYGLWFVYEDSILKTLTLAQALSLNFKKKPCLIFIILFWIVLIIVPFVVNKL